MELPAKSGPFLAMRCHACGAMPSPCPSPCHPILPIPSQSVPSHPSHCTLHTPSHPTVGNLVANAVQGHKREKEATPAHGPRRCRVWILWQSPTPSLFSQGFLPLGRVHILLPLHSMPKAQPRGAWAIFLPPARLISFLPRDTRPRVLRTHPGSMSMY